MENITFVVFILLYASMSTFFIIKTTIPEGIGSGMVALYSMLPAIYPIPILAVILLMYNAFEKLTGFSLKERIKDDINDKSKTLGYKLKMLEELDYGLYCEVDKWYLEDGDKDSGTQNSIYKYFGELLTYLNDEVHLDNGYITRRYEVITLKNKELVYSTNFTELNASGLTSVERLTQDSAVKWYKSLMNLSDRLYELKSLDEVQDKLRLSEENRIKEIQKIRELNLKNNNSIRDEVSSELGNTELVNKLEEQIEKVGKDREKVYDEGKRLIIQSIKYRE